MFCDHWGSFLQRRNCRIPSFRCSASGRMWPGGATPQLIAKRLLVILDELQLSLPTIVGIDMGGQPSLAFASMYPDRLKQLVVMNSLVFGDEKTSWEIRLLRKFGFNRFALRSLPGLIFHRAEKTFLKKGERIDERLQCDFWTAFSSPKVRRFHSQIRSVCISQVIFQA